MFNDTQDNRNLFILDKDDLNPQSPAQCDHPAKPPGEESPGKEFFSISIEQTIPCSTSRQRRLDCCSEEFEKKRWKKRWPQRSYSSAHLCIPNARKSSVS